MGLSGILFGVLVALISLWYGGFLKENACYQLRRYSNEELHHPIKDITSFAEMHMGWDSYAVTAAVGNVSVNMYNSSNQARYL
jgi:hypothetical protein